MVAGERPKPKGQSLRAFVTLSRQIMHLANKETRRSDFLRALSTTLLQFSDCDALELRLRGNVEYRVRAVCRPKELFVYQALQTDQAKDASVPPSDKHALGLKGIIIDELNGAVDPSAPCFTPYGSFWTGDVEQTVTSYPAKTNVHVDFRGARSVALVPFTVDVNNVGILRLECSREKAFSRETIESYEVVGETLGLAIAQRRSQAALHERVKELACLYGIARIVEDSNVSVDDAIGRIVELLPPGWQFSESAVARIILDGKEHATERFEAARSRQIAEIMVNGICRGTVEVGYVIDVEDAVNGVFLKEEAHLIEGVAREIGEFLGRRQAAAERLDLEAQLRHADRLATIGKLAAGVAHEINEPLGSILGYAQLARKGDGLPKSTAEDLDKIIAASLQAREIVNSLRFFARQTPIQKVPVSIASVVDEALSLVENQCANEGIEIVRRAEEQLFEVQAAPVQLKQVVVNLVVNAMQSMPGGGILTVETRFDHSTAIIEVEDNGVGMTGDVMDQIFNPFFTTKDVGEGTGLGLSVVHGIISAHGGALDVASEVGKGSKFTVRLPHGVEPSPELEPRTRAKRRHE